MARKNLVMMGLRGLLIEVIREHQRYHNHGHLADLLASVGLCANSRAERTVVETANRIASAAELAGLADEMKTAALHSLLDGPADLKILLQTFFEVQGRDCDSYPIEKDMRT